MDDISSPSSTPPHAAHAAHAADAKLKGVFTFSCSLEEIPYLRMPRNGHRESGEPSRVFCSICDDAKPPSAMKRGTHCLHVYCHECIKEYVRGEIKDDIHRIKCPDSDCKKNLSMNFCLDSSDSNELVDTWYQAKRETDAMAHPPRIRCAFFYDDENNYFIKQTRRTRKSSLFKTRRYDY